MDFVKFIREADEDKRDRDRVTEPVKTALEKRKEDSKNLADRLASIDQRKQDITQPQVNTNPQYPEKPSLDDIIGDVRADSLKGKTELSPGISHDGKDPEEPTPQTGEIKAQLSKRDPRLDLGRRRADEIDEKKKIATDLVGETPVMEAVHRIMQGINDGTLSNELLDELDQEDIKQISVGNRESIKKLRDAVYDTLPTSKQKKGDGWAQTSPVVARNIIRMLDPEKKYKVTKSGGGADGMRFTTIPEELYDFSYDSINEFMDGMIGKPKMKELLGTSQDKVFDIYDPTDIVMTSEQAPESIADKLQQLRDEYDPDDPEASAKLFKDIQQFKRELIDSKDIFNYSLKKPKVKGGKVDNHIIPRNVNRESDDENLQDSSIELKEGLQWGLGTKLPGFGNIVGSLGSLGWNVDEESLGKDVLNAGVKPHPGDGQHKNNPFSFQGEQTEPNLKEGADAKLGMMDMNFHSNPRINDYVGYDFGERWSSDRNPFGFSDRNAQGKKGNTSVRFTDDEIKKIKDLADEVFKYQGNAKVQGLFPEGMDHNQFIDKMIEGDNLWQDTLDEVGIENMPKINDRRDANNNIRSRVLESLNDDQKKRLTDHFGELPDGRLSSLNRHKVKQLLMLKALQDTEANGKLDEFNKSEILRHALKMGDEYSPYLISG